MKVNCGTDIIEIERIQESIETMGERFLERVFTPKEILYCESKKTQKYQHYAARFAAKEATFKAISDQLQDKYEIGWTDIEIIKSEQGKPSIELLKPIHTIETIDISISHCKTFAVATVVTTVK